MVRVIPLLLFAVLSGCGTSGLVSQVVPTDPPVSQTAPSTVPPVTQTSPVVPVATIEATPVPPVTETPVLAATALPSATEVATDVPSPGTDWMNRPDIRTIRTIYQEIRKGLTDGSLEVRVRDFGYCMPYGDTKRVIATDTLGRVRMYGREAGSDDSSLAWEHYYDQTGRLRFVFITGGAVNGSALEHRIYFDESGNRIWEQQTYREGPGYTFPEVWPADELQITDPAAAFEADPPCE